MYLALSCFLLLALAPLRAQQPSDFQLPPGFITSITRDVAYIDPNLPPATVTVHVAATNGAPVSSLDGLLVDFGGRLVPVMNGQASAQFAYSTFRAGGYEVAIAFPYASPPNPAVTPTEYFIAQRYQPFVTALSGEYVFRVKSYAAEGGEGVSLGVLQFSASDVKGVGDITGELDYNGALGSFQALPVTGTYSIDGNGTCKLTLQTSEGTQHFNLAIQASQLGFIGRITQGALVETDSPRLAGAGMLYARNVFNPPAQSAPPVRTYVNGTVLQLAGQSSFGGQSPLPVSLTVNSGQNELPTTVDLVSGAYVQQSVPATLGDSANPDALGRFTFPLTVQNQSAQQPSSYVGYGIDDQRVLLLSTDPVAGGKILLSGEADVPTMQNVNQ